MMQYYQVAGHVFGVDEPAAFSWDICANYRSFRLDGFRGSPLFELAWVGSLPPFEGDVVVSQEGGPDDDMPRILLSRNREAWRCRMAPRSDAPFGLELHVKSDLRHAAACMLQKGASWTRFAVDNALMLTMTFASAPLQTLLIHASAVVYRGMAYAFLAPSGTGKSTHSRLWMEHLPGVELLNDDNPVVRMEADGTVSICGSPWSGKTPCYKQRQVPLGALVQLAQAPFNAIRRLPLVEAYGALLSSSSGLKSTEPMASQLHQTLEQVLLRIPCYHLDCLPDADAAKLCSATIVPNNC